MLTQAVTRAIDEGKEGVGGHRFQETGGNIPQRFRPDIGALMHALKYGSGTEKRGAGGWVAYHGLHASAVSTSSTRRREGTVLYRNVRAMPSGQSLFWDICQELLVVGHSRRRGGACHVIITVVPPSVDYMCSRGSIMMYAGYKCALHRAEQDPRQPSSARTCRTQSRRTRGLRNI